MNTNNTIADKIISLEKQALDQWYKGNPDGYLSIYDEKDFTYFDPNLKHRVDNFESIKEQYERTVRNKVFSNTYNMVDPRVQLTKEMAVLTYTLFAKVGENNLEWNCTEVFRLDESKQWKIVHSNWSFIRPMDMKFNPYVEIV